MNEVVKSCFKCGAERPLTEFYKHPEMPDGHLNKCKECARSDARQNYKNNIERYVAYEKERFKDPNRKSKIKQYAKRRPEEKKKATNATSNAIRDGKLIKQPCEVCGVDKVEAHHDDYSKPLDVRWLCRKHHLEHHGKKEWTRQTTKSEPV